LPEEKADQLLLRTLIRKNYEGYEIGVARKGVGTAFFE